MIVLLESIQIWFIVKLKPYPILERSFSKKVKCTTVLSKCNKSTEYFIV